MSAGWHHGQTALEDTPQISLNSTPPLHLTCFLIALVRLHNITEKPGSCYTTHCCRSVVQSNLLSCRRPARSWTLFARPGLLGSGPSAGRSSPGRTGSGRHSSSAWARLGRNRWAHRTRQSSRRWGRATAPGRSPEQSCCLEGEGRMERGMGINHSL